MLCVEIASGSSALARAKRGERIVRPCGLVESEPLTLARVLRRTPRSLKLGLKLRPSRALSGDSHLCA